MTATHRKVKRVRLITLSDVSYGYMGALELLMAQQMAEGTYQPTIAIMEWSNARPSYSLGVNQDGSHMNLRVLEAAGARGSRSLAWGGGSGLLRAEVPVITYWLPQDYAFPGTCLKSEIDRAGEVTTKALVDLGVPAVYRSLADTEGSLPDGTSVKLANTGAAHLLNNQFWAIACPLLWEPISPDVFVAFSEAVHIPPIKFADKAAKTPQARMGSIREVARAVGVQLERKDLLYAVASAHATESFGAACEAAELQSRELRFLDTTHGFFESAYWVNVVSSAGLRERLGCGERLGSAAIKKRKMIEASVILDNVDRIRDLVISGEFYIHPQAEIRRPGAARWLAEAVVGLPAEEEGEIAARMEETFELRGIEAPSLTSGDFAATVVAAAQAAAGVSNPI